MPDSGGSAADFRLVLRGYDRDAVDAYVLRTSQLVAELPATRRAAGLAGAQPGFLSAPCS